MDGDLKILISSSIEMMTILYAQDTPSSRAPAKKTPRYGDTWIFRSL